MLLEQKIPSARLTYLWCGIVSGHPRFMGRSRGKSARNGPHLLPHDAARLQVMLSTERSSKWCWLFKATMSASPRIHKMKQHKRYTYATIYIKLDLNIYTYICVSSKIFLSRLYKRSSKTLTGNNEKRGRQRSCWVVGGPIIVCFEYVRSSALKPFRSWNHMLLLLSFFLLRIHLAAKSGPWKSKQLGIRYLRLVDL